jgi:ubiquinone/menaquinone biosynthesis C-methylase UbiE
VLRTFNKQPISPERWRETLAYIDTLFPVGPSDDLLDLCCGNGLFTVHFASRARTVTAVDISPDLLRDLERQSINNVKTLCRDAREAEFGEGTFSRILLYAGIQYFSEAEVILLFANLQRWLRSGGVLFIGDIPDRARLWSFYNTGERRSQYFDNCVNDCDVVGTWFDSSWLLYLAENTGFRDSQAIPQPSEQIYAHFRFDMKALR